VQRWQRDPQADDQRQGPRTPPQHELTAEEKDRIVQYATSAEYRNLSPEQVVAKLADDGVYVCSERSLRRILKARRLDTYRSRSKPPVARPRPSEHVATSPLQVLSWDITYLRNATLRGSYFYLYMYIDVFSRRIVGSAVYEEQSSELAAGLLRNVCAEHDVQVADGCVLHADNGTPMKGSTMLATMQALGIVASFSRPSVSDDNPYIESLFRHLKYAPSYPSKGFSDIEHARQWVDSFVDWYNHHHLHSAIALVTPDDRHQGRDIALLHNRRAVYRAACQKNPRRWTRSPRSWHRPDAVLLNPNRTLALQRSPRASSQACRLERSIASCNKHAKRAA
jgi:transposase InsO family protein